MRQTGQVEILTELFKYSFVLLGVVVGWLFSQLSERNKIIRDDKRKLKKIIFYLLEVRHQLKLLSPDSRNIDLIFSVLKENFGTNILTEAESKEFKGFLNQFLAHIFKNEPIMSQEETQDLNSNFNKCVDMLSEIDPVLAYKLKGRNNIPDLWKSLILRAQNSAEELTKDPQSIEVVKSIFKEIEPGVLRRAISDLDEMIFKLSKKLGHRLRKEIVQTINTVEDASSEDIKNFITGILKTVKL